MHTHVGNGCTNTMLVCTLIHDSADTHAAITSTADRDAAFLCILRLMQPFARCKNIVKHILLVEEATCIMPLVAILAAATCIYKR